MIVISRTENRENANFGTRQGDGSLKSTFILGGTLWGLENEASVIARSILFRPHFNRPHFSPPRIVRLRAYRPIALCLGIGFDRLVWLPVDRESPLGLFC